MKAKNIAICAVILLFFSFAAGFVYLKHLRIKMNSEAGIVAAVIVNMQIAYFDSEGKFLDVLPSSASKDLGITLTKNKYFTSMRVEADKDSFEMYAACEKGFFKGTQIYARYSKTEGMTDYRVNQKTKIWLPEI